MTDTTRTTLAPPPPAHVSGVDQLATAVESVVANGPAAGSRAIDLRVMGGLAIRVLPDRGADLGAAWFRDVPLAWISPVGERAPFAPPAGEEWLDAFGGGLLTTCGLRNVGWPSEGVGLHGVFSHQRARIEEVRARRDGDLLAATVRARVRDASHARWNLELERLIESTSDGTVRVTDVTRNLGARPEPAPLLYHVNVGAPVWGPEARLDIPGSVERTPDQAAREHAGRWQEGAEPALTGERGIAHTVLPEADGWCTARVTNARVGLRLTLRWEAAALPRFNQWVEPTPGVYALGLEPANCSVLGRAHDRADGTLPVLAPGEERTTRIAIGAEPVGA
jgi:hypothetical protein